MGAAMFFSPDVASAVPIQFDTARTVGFGGAAVRSFASLSRFSNRGASLRIISVPLIIPYQFTGRTVGRVIVPYVSKHFENPAGQDEETSGIGDLRLFVKHAVYRKLGKGSSTVFSLTGGLRLPSGSSRKRGRDGKRLSPLLQTGLGSVGITFGGLLTATDLVARYEFHAGLTYTANTRANDFKAGNVFQYNMAGVYRLYPARYEGPFEEIKEIDLVLELNGQHANRNKQDGRDLSASGGERVFLSPGVLFIASPRLLFEAGFQWPIIQRVNGPQLEADYRTLVGFRYLF